MDQALFHYHSKKHSQLVGPRHLGMSSVISASAPQKHIAVLSQVEPGKLFKPFNGLIEDGFVEREVSTGRMLKGLSSCS